VWPAVLINDHRKAAPVTSRHWALSPKAGRSQSGVVGGTLPCRRRRQTGVAADGMSTSPPIRPTVDSHRRAVRLVAVTRWRSACSGPRNLHPRPSTDRASAGSVTSGKDRAASCATRRKSLEFEPVDLSDLDRPARRPLSCGSRMRERVLEATFTTCTPSRRRARCAHMTRGAKWGRSTHLLACDVAARRRLLSSCRQGRRLRAGELYPSASVSTIAKPRARLARARRHTHALISLAAPELRVSTFRHATSGAVFDPGAVRRSARTSARWCRSLWKGRTRWLLRRERGSPRPEFVQVPTRDGFLMEAMLFKTAWLRSQPLEWPVIDATTTTRAPHSPRCADAFRPERTRCAP
jgi:hypothetical protein